MVRAGDAPARKAPARRRAERRAAMAAGVVEGAHSAAAIAGDDDPLVADLGHEVVAGFAQFIRAADADPVAVPDGLELARVLRRVVIPGGGQRRGRPFEQGHAPYRNFEKSGARFSRMAPIASRASAP